MSARSGVNRLLSSFEKPFVVFNEIRLDKSALLNNIEVLSSIAQHNTIIPVLKSNAYGHGLLEISKMLSVRKFPYIAVDGYFEAIAVREVSRQPVLVMGAIAPENFSKITPKNCTFVVQDERAIRAMGKSRKNFIVHLEIDTGMTRHGVEPGQILEYIKLINSFSNLKLEGVMSHLSDADNTDNTYTYKQVELFDHCVERILATGQKLKWIHIAQSAGATKVTSRYANASRTGIAMYGFNPLEYEDPNSGLYKDLEPVLELVSTVTKIQIIKKGVTVGYGCTYKAKKDTAIAVIPIGYYEGMPRELSNHGFVEINKNYYKIAGRVCMNITMVDVGNSDIKVGDKVVIISRDKNSKISALSICAENGLFMYSFLTSINQNIRRIIF